MSATALKGGLLIANLALLVLFPVAWGAPLARAGFLPFFEGEAISIFSGFLALWDADVILALTVALFAIALPLVKIFALIVMLSGLLPPRGLSAVELLGKLAMAEVFLIAIYIVVVKGVGVGRVEVAWGLYLFTALVLASMLIAHLSRRVV